MFPLLTQSYWRDEAFSVLLSLKPLSQIFSLTVKYDHAPPLYYYLLHIWMKFFGSSEISTRSLSFLGHLLTVVTVYHLCQKLRLNRLASLAVSWVVLFNPFLWQYAWESRPYSLFGLLIILTLALMLEKKLLLASVALALAILTHNFAVLFLLGFFIISVWQQRPWRLKLVLLPVLTLLVWLPFWLKQVANLSRETWLEPPAATFMLDSLKIFSASGLDYSLKPLLTLVSLLLFGLALVKLARSKLKPYLVLPTLPILLTVLISFVWFPVYLERYLLPVVPLLLVLIAASFKKLNPLLAGIYLSLLLASTWQISRLTTKPAMRQAVAQLLPQLQANEIIITKQPINFLEVYYYLTKTESQDKLYSYLYPGEDHIPDYVGVELIKNEEEILKIPPGRPAWLIAPDATITKQ